MFHFLVEDHGRFYGATSGWIGLLAYLGAIGALVRHLNCHVKGCWRHGRFPRKHYKVCAKHHPNVPDGRITAQHVEEA